MFFRLNRGEGIWITVDYEVDEGQRSNAVRVAVLKFATIDFVVGGDRLACNSLEHFLWLRSRTHKRS